MPWSPWKQNLLLWQLVSATLLLAAAVFWLWWNMGRIAVNSVKITMWINIQLFVNLQPKMAKSVQGGLEKSCLSRGLSEAVEQLMQLIVHDCIVIWMDDITSDHARIKQLLMWVKFMVLLFFAWVIQALLSIAGAGFADVGPCLIQILDYGPALISFLLTLCCF